MIDTTHIDLLALVGSATRLTRVSRAKGGEYQGPCPFCGGRDRFRVWPDGEHRGWWCRQCEQHGDAITFVQLRDSCSFGEALRTLGLEGSAPQPLAAPDPQPPEAVAPPPEAWQTRLRKFVDWCQRALYDKGATTMYKDDLPIVTWLEQRGLTRSTIFAAGIGYNDRDWYLTPASLGLDREQDVWLPKGIVFPWYVDDTLWRVVIRRPVDGSHKYHTVAGASELGHNNCPYNINAIVPGKPVILVEGVLDAIAIQQVAGDIIAPVAVGTTGARRLHWLVRIAWASRVLVALDNDQAGASGAAWWLDALREQASEWRPWWDDPAQMLQDGADVRQWIQDGLDEEPPAERAATYDAIDRHVLVSAVRDAWRAERHCYRDQGLDQGSPAEELTMDLDTLSDAELTALEACIRQRARQIPDWPGWEWLETGGPWRATHPTYGTTSTYLHLDDCVKEVRRKTPEDQRPARPARVVQDEELFPEEAA